MYNVLIFFSFCFFFFSLSIMNQIVNKKGWGELCPPLGFKAYRLYQSPFFFMVTKNQIEY